MVSPWVLVALLLLSGCTSAPVEKPRKPDPTQESWYRPTVEQLARLNRKAEELFRKGKPDPAAALIVQAQPLASRLLAVPQPTLAAMEAASDLDDLYGRMLLSNRHYGWARLLFQKNQARWRQWEPKTADTQQRRAQAEAAIAECDRHLGQ